MRDSIALVLGAGPAGLGAAFELSKAGMPVAIVEKNSRVGGLARTLQFHGFKTDIGPHRFFAQNQATHDFAAGLLGKSFLRVNRQSRFYVNGKFFFYPVKLENVLFGIVPWRSGRMFFDYLLEQAKKTFAAKEAASFEEHVVSSFGRGLAELNILNYSEKVWGMQCRDISPDWAEQRIKGLSFKSLLKNAVVKQKNHPKALIDAFHYPENGTGMLYEKISRETLKKGNAVLMLNSRPEKIIHKNGRIESVVIKSKGKRKTIRPGNVISAVPITELAGLLCPKPPPSIMLAAKGLRFRSHVSLFLTLKKKSVFPGQWIYFPEKEIPFARAMEPKNFSKRLSPPGKTSLLLEFFCWHGDETWNASKEALFGQSVPWLRKMGLVERNDVTGLFAHREPNAYPVFDLNYKKRLQKVMQYLGRFENLCLIGRSGAFMYNNQDQALEMGFEAAKSIINGKHFLPKLPAKQGYLEGGPAR